jgi:uncharacterized protein YbgA (DUF1722 family)/uncharacterized protein YbbK (DUF523 family)
MSQQTENRSEFRQGQARIGVSACLLGARVRFDGGHKRNRFLIEELGEHFEFVAFCPEVAIGMGTPRPTLRLVGDVEQPRALGSRDASLDVTKELLAYSASTANRLQGLSGFVFKKDSPSCGMERVKVYNDKGMPQRDGTGIFARAVQEANPLLPVEEEGRLNDPVLRENFVSRVFVYANWQWLRQQGMSRKALLDFHTGHKLLLMAHSPAAYRELGRMLAQLDKTGLEELADVYIARVMQVLKTPATRKRHVNVLQHVLGYLRKHLDATSRANLADVIDSYRRGAVPLVVPITLLQHCFRRTPHPWISRQVYMNPHPPELMLRNTI